MVLTISNLIAATASDSTGRYPTRIWRPTTTKSSGSSACTAPPRGSRTRRIPLQDASCRRRRPWSAITWCSSAQGAWGFPSFPGHRAVLTQQLDFKRSPALLHPGNLKAQKILRNAHAAALGLHLGHRLRPRLLDPGELSVDHRASAAGARDRQPRHRVQRHGQRGRAGKKRPRQGREIHRQGQRRGAPGERARGRARGQRLRDGAYSAQLQERAVPGWPCQFQRQGRALHHGHRRRPI